MTDEVRKWPDKPYGPNDSRNFATFERDLMDDLKASRGGFEQVLWNSPSNSNPETAKWLYMIQYVEKDSAKILEESVTNKDEQKQFQRLLMRRNHIQQTIGHKVLWPQTQRFQF